MGNRTLYPAGSLVRGRASYEGTLARVGESAPAQPLYVAGSLPARGANTPAEPLLDGQPGRHAELAVESLDRLDLVGWQHAAARNLFGGYE